MKPIENPYADPDNIKSAHPAIRDKAGGNATPKERQELLRLNPALNSTDMRDLLLEYGTPSDEATRLTQDRREAEWRANGQA
jgi:hypothetical protein